MKKMPSYIRGKYAIAANDLMDILTDMGVNATVGYAEPRDGKLYVYVVKGAIVKVPKTFGEFGVVAQMAGAINPA